MSSWPPKPVLRNKAVNQIALYLSELDSSSIPSKLMLAMRVEDACFKSSNSYEDYQNVINKKLMKAKKASEAEKTKNENVKTTKNVETKNVNSPKAKNINTKNAQNTKRMHKLLCW